MPISNCGHSPENPDSSQNSQADKDELLLATIRKEGYGVFKETRVSRWERRLLLRLLTLMKWNVSSTARAMGMDRSNLKRLIKSNGINENVS